jgi:predicted dehydrogenase
MIRLAIRGIDDCEAQHLSVRLRNTFLVEWVESGTIGLPVNCSAVVFLKSTTSDLSLIEKCLAEGIHVLLSGAPGFSSEDITHLSAVAAHSDAQFSVVNPDRYLPSRQLIYEQLRNGHLGELGLVRSHRWESQDPDADSELSLPRALIRDLELTMWLFGAFPDVVYAVDRTNGPAAQEQLGNTELPKRRRFAQVHLGFSRGGMALVDYSDGLPAGNGYQMLSVIGSAGVVHADDHRNMQLHFAGGQPRGFGSSERAHGLTSLVQEFVDSLISGRDLSSGVMHWQRSLRLVAAVRRSLNTRNSLTLKDL